MKDDLTKQEYDWLLNLARGGGSSMIPGAVAERLKDLGYAEQKLGGISVSTKGHEGLLRGPN